MKVVVIVVYQHYRAMQHVFTAARVFCMYGSGAGMHGKAIGVLVTAIELAVYLPVIISGKGKS